ncbi:MAG TPA: M3 family metallopeptidase [Burkholderiaceae bacterium]|nr:M3 family metallopeptidase [Burkholderiaceae bacterium]
MDRLKPAALLVGVFALDLAAAQPAGRQVVPLLDAATITVRCEPELKSYRALVRAMEARQGPDGVLEEFNRLTLATGDFMRPVALMSNVSPDKATRDAAKACLQTLTPFYTEIYQSRALFERVDALKPRNAVDAQYRADLIESFEDSGASLPPEKQARVKAINEELTRLSLAFRKAIDEDPTKVTVTLEEATGLPPAWIAARKRDDAGNLVLDLEYPTILPFLSNSTSEAARERLSRAVANRGGKENLVRLDRAVVLRHELAQLYGYPDYPTFLLRRRMAETPAAVFDFMRKVKGTVEAQELRELGELKADKAALLGKPVNGVTLNRWDVGFHQERIRRARYAVNQEELRAYFPTDASVKFALKVAERLYGIEVAEAEVPRWHPDVRYFDVYDRKADGTRGVFLGGIYLDLYPREGKYSHAAAAPTYPASALAQRKPASVMMANFNRTGLTASELRTLLHEFGHVLHGVLSTARYAAQAGTSVKRDFVEAPSQMFEDWARRPESLAVFAEVCPQCPRLTAEQIKRIESARNFGRGIHYSGQLLYADYDMTLHSGAPKPSLATWITLEKATPLGHVEGTMKPANFGHLMGGYAAGYYGYLWSEVLAYDMLAAFDGRLMDEQLGRRYRATVLSPGGEQSPRQLVESFLGRPLSPDAFFAELTRKE